MGNDCHNSLRMFGSSEKVAKFREASEWRLKEVAKYDEMTVETDGYPPGVNYWFKTNWSPPMPLVAELSAEHPDLLFVMHFSDTPPCFEGVQVIKGGKNGHAVTWNYSGGIEIMGPCSPCVNFRESGADATGTDEIPF